jgi:hypothetical protein
MTTLYIAGPMRGLPDFNFPAFAQAAAQLRAAGYGVVSPHELHSGALHLVWAEYMRRDIALLCSGAIGGLAMLPGWEGSQGAVLERRVALAIGLDVRTVTEWPLEWCSHD